MTTPIMATTMRGGGASSVLLRHLVGARRNGAAVARGAASSNLLPEELTRSKSTSAICRFQGGRQHVLCSSGVLVPATSLAFPSLAKNRTACSFSTEAAAVDDEEDAVSSSSSAASAYTIKRRRGVRNVAIVAHVDHGKTTLVDELLKATGRSLEFSSVEGDKSNDSNGSDPVGEEDLNRLMDSGELERERGITITSKVTRMDYYVPPSSSSDGSNSGNDHVICNVVDTPGHSDFAGEVDRVLSTVDGIVLVVDAAEGPKSQTKYVLGRALNLGLVPVVVLNKADRDDARQRIESGETESELLDLFDSLGADEHQMEYRTLYGSARNGWVTDDLDLALTVGVQDGVKEDKQLNMTRLLDAILEDIPPPSVHWYASDGDGGNPGEEEEEDALSDDAFTREPFSMTATTVGFDQFLGRTCTGRIHSGTINISDVVSVLRREDTNDDNNDVAGAAGAGSGSGGPSSTISGVFANRGVSRVALDPPVASAGDIVTLTGVPDSIRVGDTLTSTSNPVLSAIDTPPLAPPTLSCFFGANNGPLAGTEGSIVTSSRVRARLISETDNNVTITVTKSESDSEKTVVYGRGELQIGILVEQMRREGYEMIISPPRIVTSMCPDTGKKMEPFEEVFVDVDAEYSGTVVNALTGARKGVLVEMSDDNDGKTRLVFHVPSRGLLGFGPEIATSTRGTAVIHHSFLEDREHCGNMGSDLEKGKLVANDSGKATLFALENLANRGTLFVAPGEMVYPGMVIGESNKSGDLEVNPVKAKAVNNMRTQNKEEKLYLPPPKRLSVEELIGYMGDDEVIEVTPVSVRLRKAELDAGKRERAARAKKKQQQALKENAGKGRRK